MGTDIKPLFLFSLPRSGSTMSQRILSLHNEIDTVAEPWLLLPFLYTLRERGVYSEYRHRVMVQALQDFCGHLPGGESDYLSEVKNLVMRLYSKASRGNPKYFLDKTPRYHFVVEDIISLFPEGKFIFLWRNPLAIAASMMKTWSGGKWNLHYFKQDLFDGLNNLTRAFSKNLDKVISVKFENLLLRPEEEWQRVFDYLGLSFEPSLLRKFDTVSLTGTMGDPDGILKYQAPNKEPINIWKQTLRNPIRKAWCRLYLRWIGKRRLSVMGYSSEALLAEVQTIPSTYYMLASDILRILPGACIYGMRSSIFNNYSIFSRL
jgi:hypothetical protein